VIDRGSMRGAAEALGVPKSTVGRRVAALERRLGVRLLERTTRQIHVTDAGKRYYDEAVVAVAALERAERAATDLQSAPKGTLRVAVPVNIGPLVPPMLVEFARQYPELRVVVDVSDRAVDLVREGFDVALHAGTDRLRDSTLVSRRISQTAIQLFASGDYLRRRGTPRRPEDLLEHDCLVFGTSERATWELTRGRIKKKVQVHGRVAMNSQPALRDLAIAGMGIARLPEAVCREALARRQLEVVLPRFSTSPGGIFILYPGGRYVSPKVRAFVEFVTAQLTVVRSRRAPPA
jgi:DNA-binding transcriptional LysR family regulator